MASLTRSACESTASPRAAPSLTFARLLEEVAAFGGVLRAFGVGPGERVLSRLPMGSHGLVAALATARLGAAHVVVEEYADAAAPLAAHRPAVVIAEGRTRCSRRRWRPWVRDPMQRSGAANCPTGTISSGTS